MRHFLDDLLAAAAGRISERIDPFGESFSAFVFKDSGKHEQGSHRDRIAFMRICSKGKFTAGMEVMTRVQAAVQKDQAFAAAADDGAGASYRQTRRMREHHRYV